MAIYHFSVVVISRARGQRIVAVAAARAGVKLRDDYYGMVHNHQHRPGVEFAEIAAPDESPSWAFDRERLWNRVEAAECRKDSQLARAIEISLPFELDFTQRIALLRDYVHTEFISKRMIADMTIRQSRSGHPNAYVLLTLREAHPDGFGPKMREWNRKNNLLDWRTSWAACANLHLARGGHAVRIDHRSLDAQQIELAPARRTGIGRTARLLALPDHLRERFEQQQRIAAENGSAILEDPALAIRALARQRRCFTRADLERFLKTRTDGQLQLEAALTAIMACSELVALEATEGASLYTSRDLVEAQKSLLRRADNMTKRGTLLAVSLPVGEWNDFRQTMRRHWDERGKHVRDAMPVQGESLAEHDVVLLQGAEMIDLKTLEKLLDVAERVRATMVLVADAERLRVMGAMSPMQELIARTSPLIPGREPLVP